MRASTLSSLAVLASSLLVTEVFAGRYDVRKRDNYVVIDNVIVTDVVYVTEGADGSLETAAPVAVGTVTVGGVPVLVPATTAAAPTVVPTSSSTSVAVSSSPTTSSSSSALGAVLIEQSHSVSVPAATSSTPVPVVPTTSSIPAPVVVPASSPPAPVVVPTTLATVASSAAPVSTASSSGVKRGLAYNDASILSGFGSKVSWAYNWGSSTASLSGLEYVPMLWGMASSFTNSWIANANAAIKAGSTHLLAFNEPDYSGQSNLSPSDAAAGYKTYMQPFAGRAKLGSPAITNGGAPMGMTWLSSFLSECSSQSLTVDFIALHWYNGGSADDFQTYVKSAHQTTNLPVWITEFQAPGDTAQQTAFLEQVLPWLDSQSYVERYSYFMASEGILLTSGSTLSALGQAYASVS